MEKITGIKTLTEIADEESWVPSDRLDTAGYGNIDFECGCGKRHVLSLTPFIHCATPVKFVTVCSKNICTLVRVKGIFSQSCESQWSCKRSLFEKYLTSIQMGEAIKNLWKD